MQSSLEIAFIAEISRLAPRPQHYGSSTLGRFVWPQAISGSVHLSSAQLSMLLEGIDWRRPQRTWQPQLSA